MVNEEQELQEIREQGYILSSDLDKRITKIERYQNNSNIKERLLIDIFLFE